MLELVLGSLNYLMMVHWSQTFLFSVKSVPCIIIMASSTITGSLSRLGTIASVASTIQGKLYNSRHTPVKLTTLLPSDWLHPLHKWYAGDLIRLVGTIGYCDSLMCHITVTYNINLYNCENEICYPVISIGNLLSKSVSIISKQDSMSGLKTTEIHFDTYLTMVLGPDDFDMWPYLQV